MNKNRVEAFTDAIIAIIATIMVLEFKTPTSYGLDGIIEELPYLFAYGTSFFFILVAWYNHHYMFALIERVTKKVYWLNNLWLFTMSLLPVSTAWVGRFVDKAIPEWFYFFTVFIWTLAYIWLTLAIVADLKQTNQAKAQKVLNMPAIKFLSSWYVMLTSVIVLIAVAFFPPIVLIMTILELISMAILTPADSDRVA
ncbi:putative membrane protein [Weissella oryzae SG25]|uniref:Putative membrane protein n=1 Tax=Weissella oryzae (strain DSM 25784 / JCM 18191 / LMG 30913 / SG25) TaxID=1329250 RepID=A0A069CV89_WEIOS|nr:TMEM175 family protein [Weissella oryzae]GAK31384.1 putative membrane protein [Weissella oryzae SG25]